MRSLTLRLALLAALWVAAGLVLAGWFVAGLAERQMRAAADARLGTLVDGVVAVLGADVDGVATVQRPPSGAAFDQPLSGEYWQVSAARGAQRVLAQSRSLWDARLPPPAVTGTGETALRSLPGPRGEPLRLLERVVELPNAPAPWVVQVGLDATATEREIARLHRGLALVLLLLGVGLVAGVALQVVHAMRRLRGLRDALAEVRAGRRERLAMPAPSEVAPLVEEVDALIAQNQATLDRARAHAGNLAHALKTPVSVLRNALDRPAPDTATALDQVAALERTVQHHMARARSAALGTGGTLAAPLEAARSVARALQRLQAERGLEITVTGDAAARVRVDGQDLVEMIGNLMENACKWAVRRVAVRVEADPAARRVRILVEDDGPGLPDGTAALARGVRLDEAMPGAGLGLAIVRDLAALHGGGIDLTRGEALPGAMAVLDLPAGG